MRIFNLIITTEKRWIRERHKFIDEYSSKIKNIHTKCIWSAINPVIHDLEKLRANTWDQDKITTIQCWLRNNFEVKQ